MEWISLLQTLGGIAGGVGIGMFTKAGRKRDMAEADLRVQEVHARMIQNYEERIKELHENKKRLNEEADHYIERISKQNHALDSKTDQIRALTEKLWTSEQEVNRVNNTLNEANATIARLIEERDAWKAKAEYYRQWQCHSSICTQGNPDPAGRQPPNAKLRGQKFKEPK